MEATKTTAEIVTMFYTNTELKRNTKTAYVSVSVGEHAPAPAFGASDEEWSAWRKGQNKFEKPFVMAAFPEATEAKWSRKAGCGCGCSAGWKVAGIPVRFGYAVCFPKD